MKSAIRIICISLLLTHWFLSFAQDHPHSIRGTILNENNERLPYASIQIKGTKTGTISNEDGEFIIKGLNLDSDTLIVFYMGYISKEMPVSAKIENVSIILEKAVNYLNEVEVVGERIPDAYSMLKNLIKAYRKDSNKNVSKAFLSLYSANDQPLEILEAFYNARVSRQKGIEKLQLKNGRAGLITNNDFAFVSLNTTDILSDFSPFSKSTNQKLPSSPTNLGFSTLKILYDLEIEQFIDYPSGTIAVIRFKPKAGHSKYFSGKVYFDFINNILHRLILETKNTQNKIFTSIQDAVTVDSLDIKLELIYDPISASLQTIVFDYSFILSGPQQKRIRSKALLAFYDYDSPFSMPVSGSLDLPYDYQRILSYPYSDVFWKENYYIPRSKNRVDFTNYFKTHGCLINHDSIASQSRYIQSPYLNWSEEQRLAWNDIPAERPKSTRKLEEGQITIHYISASNDNLKCVIFLDYEQSNGKTYFSSRASIDRSLSFLSKMPRNNLTLVYLNIFFDLHEIYRRQMIETLNNLETDDRQEIEQAYEETIKNLNTDLSRLNLETRKICDAETLKKWNDLVVHKLGINNFELFGIQEQTAE